MVPSSRTDSAPPKGGRERHIVIVAGEASGDLHGAALARELKALDANLFLAGIGGAGMTGAGVRILYDIANLAVMGVVEVLGRLREIRRAMNVLEKHFAAERPDLLILIDYPGFNLELARRAKKFDIPVLYYISPKIWAWREDRIRRIKKYVDRMAVILPFEKSFYRGHGMDVDFVGNPLLDQVQPPMTREEFRARAGIDPEATVIGIMPGSRRQEIATLLPLFMQAALKLHGIMKKSVFLLPLATTLSEADIRKYSGQVEGLDIRLVKEQRYAAMAACDAAMAASGTLTMELAILGVPMVVCYRLALLSYLLAKAFIKVRYVSLVNLVAEKKVVTELLQHRATPENIYTEILPLLNSGQIRTTMLKELKLVRDKLGKPGASRRVAEMALGMMAQERPGV